MIEVTQIRKSYGKKKVLSDITFQVKPGECVAIAGKNGCGKSTLMQIMAGTPQMKLLITLLMDSMVFNIGIPFFHSKNTRR